jgi:hypothetical protein
MKLEPAKDNLKSRFFSVVCENFLSLISNIFDVHNFHLYEQGALTRNLN